MRWFDRFSVRFLTLSLALAVVGFGAAGCFGPAAQLHRAMLADGQFAARHAGFGPMSGLVGSWQVQASPQVDPHDVTVLATLTGDGGVLVSDPGQPSAGLGAWSPTGPNRADLTYLTLVNGDDGTVAVTIKTSASVEYDPATDTVSGRYTVTATDPSGAVISSNYGPVSGTRIVAEAPAATLAAPPEMPAAPDTNSAEAPAAAADLAADFDAFIAAVNAHDVDAALALFAPDAVAGLPDLPPPNEYSGTDELRAWLQHDADDNIQVEITDAQTQGDTVSAQASVHVDSLPPDLTLAGTVEVTVQDGKITSFLYTLDDATKAALQQAQPQ